MMVAGVMSGTSADGINVALVRLPRFELLGQAEYAYPKNVRAAVLAAMNAGNISVAELARLNFLLGELYAQAVLATEKKFKVRSQLIGCHGQTLYHQGQAAKFLGQRIAATWQTGEAAIIAARTGRPVVSDFRPADMAAGGQGAPLVPYLDYFFYRDRRVGRVLQNIGGIANLTAIPAAASSDQLIAFDTGPGNMVMDALSERLFDKTFDSGGRLAARGRVMEAVVKEFLSGPFFRRRPPRTAGREEFGREFAENFLTRCGKADKHDVIATATALTARSIAGAIRRFLPVGEFQEMIVAGGGASNPALMAMLRRELKQLEMKLRTSDEFGLPAAAKEAAAFALLAYETWRHRPSNVPAATGARRPAILGKISYA
jgi:anhydro-N-acetylmuramic acid kinase